MVIKMEDVGYFHKDELIIAQNKLDQIDITDNDQLIEFITDFIDSLEDRVYTTDIHVHFENYVAMMDAAVYHHNKTVEYINYIKERLPNCNIMVTEDNNICLKFIGNASHSASIIAELLKIEATKIDTKKSNIGVYYIHL